MKSNEELRLDVQLMPNLEAAIEHWLAARDTFKLQSSDENEYKDEAHGTISGSRGAYGTPKPPTRRVRLSGIGAVSLPPRPGSPPIRAEHVPVRR
jgi:hypothetical protein